MTIRVVLADDHPVTRAGIRAALEKAPDIEVVSEAANGAAAHGSRCAPTWGCSTW